MRGEHVLGFVSKRLTGNRTFLENTIYVHWMQPCGKAAEYGCIF